ncbi:MAG: EAL domain-containing protein [Methyloligellaceae bacterium]
MPDKVNAKRLIRGRNPFLEFAILCAMGSAALAFAVGLYLSASVGLVAALIAGVALFLVMAASQAALTRAHRFSEIVDRIEELQGSIMRFNDDVDRIDRFALKCKQFDDALGRVAELDAISETCRRIDPLAERVRGLERLADKYERIDPMAERVAALERLGEQCGRIDPLAERVAALDQFADASRQIGPLADRVHVLQEVVGPFENLDVAAVTENVALVQRLSATTERLDARLEALRKQVQIEGRERQDKLRAELQLLQTLVGQLAEQIATGAEPAAAIISSPHLSLAEQALAGDLDPDPYAAEQEEGADDGDAPMLDGEHLDRLMLDQIRHAIESNKIDLFLQPIVGLPQRRPRYYEALSRLRNAAGDLILPRDYIPVAEEAGIMPMVDNMMLFRSVQVLRRLSERSNARGLFCNISVDSLLDPEFFPEFTSFMDQNRTLADSLFFEFSQDMVKNCGPIEHESLAALSSLGFRFSLDRVSDLDVEFQSLHELGFRFVKIDAEIFLHGMAEAGARIHQADMRSYLERFGIDLIVEKIEDEHNLTNVLDNDAKLGQGFLFSEPRPVRPEVFAGKDAAEAA